ncbi:MAG TPA: hypothetical protein VLC09_14835 [Polyangiaceae bacterium]|nr:hypothetical protein [Polyangiaceae bacterium]
MKISDAGLSGTVDYWVASCRGQRHHCSRRSTGKGDQVTCVREEEPAAPVRVTVPRSFPTEALGFRFGLSLDAARRACVDAGYDWAPGGDGYDCTGTPKSVGFPTSSRLVFCSGALCDLTVFANFDAGDADADKKLNQLISKLKRQYDPSETNRPKIPSDCAGTVVACIAEGRASWSAR